MISITVGVVDLLMCILGVILFPVGPATCDATCQWANLTWGPPMRKAPNRSPL